MAKKMLKRDFVGRRAILRRQINNGRGDILDQGEIVKIDGTYRGRFTIKSTTTCQHCYRRQKVVVSQISENDLRLIDEDAQVTMCEKPPEVVIVSNTIGDWAGIYVKGVLKEQGHSLTAGAVLVALGVKYEEREMYMDPYTMASLPDKLSDVPRGETVQLEMEYEQKVSPVVVLTE